MSIVTRDELRKALKQNQVGPLYLLMGEEDFLRDRALAAISNHILKDSQIPEFNSSAFNLNQTTISDVLAAANQLPMLSPRRLVTVSGLNKLGESDETPLASYLVAPAETTTLVFVTTELDKRRKTSKLLIDKCQTVEFALLKDAELVQWARGYLKEKGVEADENLLRRIISTVGDKVRMLSNELDKLATAAIDTRRITADLVDDLVGRSRELSNFVLADHLIAGNKERAMTVLNQILDDDVEPVLLLGMIGGTFHRLAIAKGLMARGASEQEVFRLVGPMFGSRKQDFLSTARRTDTRSITEKIRRIAACDLAIKTSRATPRLQLQILINELSK